MNERVDVWEAVHMPNAREAPSIWWRYAQCHGGPYDGQYRDIPSFALPGRGVRWNLGCYQVGAMREDSLIRDIYFIDEGE